MERKRYLSWAEKIVYSRADAIVSGQHRNHYGEVAGLLAIVREIKESMGKHGAKSEIFFQFMLKYKKIDLMRRSQVTPMVSILRYGSFWVLF